MHETTPENELASSPVVSRVFAEVLAAVHEGTLRPGQHISDAELARQFGVSRTPVREALQRLREIGIIEASASRFTRVADVTPVQTAQALVVWLALYEAIIDEVIPTAPTSTLDVLEQDHADLKAAIESVDLQRIATSTFWFYGRLAALSHNPALQRALVSVVHVVRLGSLHLPEYVDFDALVLAQQRMIVAVRDRDLAAARESLAVLRQIQVPLK